MRLGLDPWVLRGICRRASLSDKKPQYNGQDKYAGHRFSRIVLGTRSRFEFGGIEHYRTRGWVPPAAGDSTARCPTYASFRHVGCSATLVPLLRVLTIGTVSLERYVAPAVRRSPFPT